MTSEIGSEFHRLPIENGPGLIFPRPGTLVFSGRTAIEAVLQHLSDAHTVLLPSYCCDSLIVPFRAIGIEVKFYDVNWSEGLKIDINDSADILLWCNYFGYRIDMPKFDGIIIEDITHSLLSKKQYHEHSDYLVASIRKWEPINCGGYCSVDVDFSNPSDDFVRLKTATMELKSEYLVDQDKEKKLQFLSMFRESNQWLAKNYSGLSIDRWSQNYISSIDLKKQRLVRQENAKALYEGLEGKVQFMFPIEDMDCPLFVPILLRNRDDIRKHLTTNEIYCPIHWPKPKGCRSNIYDQELSLICDQRYGIDDMHRIISVLTEVL